MPQPATAAGTCFDNATNQDETNVDCGGVCGGYWYDGSCHETPHPSVPTAPNITTPKATCTDGIRNQDEMGIDCGGVCGGYWYDLKCNTQPKNNQPISSEKPISTGAQLLDLRVLAKSNPESAKNGCLNFDDEKVRDSCLKSVAQTAMESSYCELIYDNEERDLCYYPFFMQGDYSVCDKLTVKESLQTCAQLKQIADLQANPPQPPPEEPVVEDNTTG